MPWRPCSLRAKSTYRFVKTLKSKPKLPVELPPGQQQFTVIDLSKPRGHRLVPATRARARCTRTRESDY